MAMTGTAGYSWETIKPRAIALAIGLVMGPFISNFLGWQVTSSSAQRQLSQSVTEQQALFCEARARADVKEPSKLDYTARRNLAEKWAVMPGKTSAESGVVSACADKLVG
ncbi:MAG TPA: hypothetical protein VJ890_04455 [Vineibacter sp.]|nr:hypothetical protein [Vineibacter sp.]